MRWNCAIILVLTVAASRSTTAQDNQEAEGTTIITTIGNLPNNLPSSVDSPTELDSKLRTALLKALTDLEGDQTRETTEVDNSSEVNEQDIERAQASAVTIFHNGNLGASISSSEDQSGIKVGNEDIPKVADDKPAEDPPKEKAEIVLLQKSDALQAHSIASLEKNPLDPFKDAEQIITSASNSFASKNEERNSKIIGYSTLNTISNSESKKPSKTILVEKFSIGKAVDEPAFVKTYVRPLGLSNIKSELTQTSITSSEDHVSSETNENSDDIENSEKTNSNGITEVTEPPVEVSTEESEAKVEQVQFFSAPLVAAFTVHQDEKGRPKKVEPIYKNGLNSKKEETIPTVPQPISQTILQSSTFNDLGLQQKQKILEQELEKLRSQQQNILTRNIQSVQNIDSNTQSFNRAINQNFNQFDPVFTEPDRSIVTKLATIDPSKLLAQNGGPFLNKFVPQEAILTRVNLVQPSSNRIAPELKPINLPPQTNANADVSLVPSISFDPLEEAGKLPVNAQILPNKEPTGFHSFVRLPKLQNQQNFLVAPSPHVNAFQASSNLIQSGQEINRPSQTVGPSFNGVQPSGARQNFLPNRFLKQEAAFPGQNAQFSQQNRFLRQEQDTSNAGFNRNSFSIVPAQQPFAPKHELTYFPDSNNRFFRQSEVNVGSQNNQNTRLFPGQSQNSGFQGFANGDNQNQNRFFRSSPQSVPQKVNIQPSIQPFGPQPLSSNSQSNRFFRSNQENTLVIPQNFGLGQSQKLIQNNRILRSNQENTFVQTPLLQNYKYSNSFGFRSIPLN